MPGQFRVKKVRLAKYRYLPDLNYDTTVYTLCPRMLLPCVRPAARRGYQGARAARGAWWTTIRFLKLYGGFSSLFMVKHGSETPRYGEPWEPGDD
jgi:hypothetical protein